jgi:hypothetical protein
MSKNNFPSLNGSLLVGFMSKDFAPVAMMRRLAIVVLLVTIAVALPACRAPAPEQPDTPVPDTPTAPAATAAPTATPRIAPTPTAVPTITPRAIAPTPEAAAETPNARTIQASDRATAAAEAQSAATPTAENGRSQEVQAATPVAPAATPVAIATPAIPLEPATMIPLTDMGTATYYGFEGGLYPGGSNEMPAAHAQEGLRRAEMIQPLNAEGLPDPGGNYVFLSIGMSNTAMEFCSALGVPHDYNIRTCYPYSFMGQSAADPAVNRTELIILNGARGGQVARTWVSPAQQNYDRIRDELLTPRGLSEQQVQVFWVKVVDPAEGPTLPSSEADAYRLMRSLADIVRTLKIRYPNLQQVFVSSRIYAGYADERGEERSPEPYAYESGFAVKWLIEAQIRQMESGQIDPLAGDLNYDTVAPWLAWGPYLWADGLNPRADGLIWSAEDFTGDGVHPTVRGRTKVATMLLNFFKSSSFTQCWFLTAGICE